MQIEIVKVKANPNTKAGQGCGLGVDRTTLDADVITPGDFRRLEPAVEGGAIVELAAQCDGGMAVVRLSEFELRQMAKKVRADDIPPTV